ncbi:Initiation factor 2 subunit family protein [Trichomonas vaginalis G3]|uniref:Translation initiation factor eIF2B subunit beta n=1 Tax=Trichomonas vaginalis (strain ATCC PRA-98 / G3) TaxID=412133 RepID=A2DZ22_TRIV3|nr:translation initiation factor protein [Trichomonas vaginalis G3]EAY14298.1 Initiation factor 2 subunit family protein [Trichomonas vaginalis G3]KAI5517325.1 translation initiation factor protein [Trichomonas vaginalis G3]|eukprot:XP_001326521.1 Initiation factor 2 subunit family protein [Trichomonas vaginalis G3]
MNQVILDNLLKYELKIRRNNENNSHHIAIETINLILDAIKNAKSNANVEDLIRRITDRLIKDFPNDTIIKNICSQVIVKLEDFIKDYHQRNTNTNAQMRKSHSLLQIISDYTNFTSSNSDELLSSHELPEDLSYVMKSQLEELMNDLSNPYPDIAKNASDYLHANDVVLTIGRSESVAQFIVSAKCELTVFIPLRAPRNDGIDMANKIKNLLSTNKSSSKVKIVVIPDASVFAIIPKVNVVLLSARTVFANGGIISFSLSHAAALAASRYSKTVIALYWEMKLTSDMYHPGETYAILKDPRQVMDDEIVDQTDSTIIYPDGDSIPPELITLMKNESKAHVPTDVFSIVQQNYFVDE